MKDLGAKIKSADYKQLTIDHGEKVLAGLLGLLLLLALSATSWSTYDRTPGELTQKVSSARSAIRQGTWPKKERELYTLTAGLQDDEVHSLLNADENRRADFIKRMQDEYEYRTRFFQSVYRRVEPARQPELLAAIDPIATPGRAIIAFTPPRVEPDPEKADGSKEKTDSLLRGNFGQRGADDVDGAAVGLGGPNAVDGNTGMGMSGTEGDGQNARGMRFISVRYIVDLRRQIEKYRIALSLSSNHDAAPKVVYDDFHLQRRSKPASGTQDYSDWEEVDLRFAKEILEEAAGWDPFINDIAITDPVLTMSLVSRVVRYWSKEEASHPRVDNYVLPPRQRELQMLMVEAVLDQTIERAVRAKERRPRGFATTQRNSGLGRSGSGYGIVNSSSMRGPASGFGVPAVTTDYDRGAMRNRGVQNRQLNIRLDEIARRLNKDNPEKIKQQLLAQYMKSQTASGHLLLFRYIDFDVKPATTYQYRVELVLVNPNFNQPTQSLIDPEIGKQEFLTTPMSEPTAAVTVPEDVKYYLTQVDRENGANPPRAVFDVFQWSTDFGTTINTKLKVYFGAFVGDRTMAEVLDPARRQFRKGKVVEFKSNDVLVDVSKVPLPINAADHPDLEQLPLEKRKKGLGVAAQALIVNQFGDLVAYDPISLQGAYKRAQGDLKKEREPFQDLQDKSRVGGNDGTAVFDDYEKTYAVEGQRAANGKSGRKGRRSQANPLRKRRKSSRRGSSSEGPM